MSDRQVDPTLGTGHLSPEASAGRVSDPAIQSVPSIAIEELHATRRGSNPRVQTSTQQLQDFIDSNFQGIKENADRLKKEGLISEEIWRALQQNQSQIEAANLSKQIADHMHSVGQNKKLSAEELGKLLDSQDTDLSLVRNRSVSEKQLFEVTSEIRAGLQRAASDPNPVSIADVRERIHQYVALSGTTSGEALNRLERALAMQSSTAPLQQFIRQHGLSSELSGTVPSLSHEVQKLAGVLTPAELQTVSTAFDQIKKGDKEGKTEAREREEVSRILERIAQDQNRASALGIQSGNSQVVAHQLANRVFDHNGGALLAQIFVQSAAMERTATTAQSSPGRTLTSAERFIAARAEATPTLGTDQLAPPVRPEPVRREPARVELQQVNHTVTLEKQKEQLLQQVQVAATAQASSDFARNPGGAPDLRATRITLNGLLARHPELQSHPEIQKVMLEKFQSRYQAQFDSQFQSMSWLQRSYYSFTSQWAENFKQIGNFFDRVVETIKSLPETTTRLVEKATTFAASAVKSTYTFLESTVTFLTSAETWNSVGSFISSSWNFLTNPATWSSLYDSVKSGLKTAAEFVSNPENWKKLGTMAWEGLCSAGTFLYEVATDPKKLWEATKAVGGFLYDVGKSLGVNDMLWGTWKLIEGAGRLALAPLQFGYSLAKNGVLLLTGQQSFDSFCSNISTDFSNSYGKALSCIAESAVAVKGAVLALGELTGITDCVMCVYYLTQGNYAMAAMHGGFALLSWGSIAATIATGGAAVGAIAAVSTGRMTVMQGVKSVGKVALQQVAKEGFEALGKETGEKVMKEITKEVGAEVLPKKIVAMTGKIVEEGVSELATQVAKVGKEALVGKTALEQVQKMFSEIAHKHTHELLKELKVFEHVKSSVLDLLKSVHGKASIKEIEERLVKMGLGHEAAKASALSMRRALVHGVSDKEIAEILTKQITDEITKAITKEMEKPFKEAFAQALRGELDTEAGKKMAHELRKKGIKLTEQEIDDLVEAGWKGCKEGVEKAVREVVERAVKQAFEEFRRRKWSFGGSILKKPLSESTVESIEATAVKASESPALSSAKAPGERVHEVEKRRKITRQKTTLLMEQTEETEEELF